MMLSNNFEMKDLGVASYVLGIEIIRDRSRCLLGLSQKAYIDHVLKRFNMEKCAPGEVPINKGDKFSSEGCPRNEVERNAMEGKPYASLVGSLMYAQVCTRPDIAFAVSVLGRYQSNPGLMHWTAAKKVLRYLQRTKSFMLVYGRSDKLEVTGYTDSDFAGCIDDRRSTSGYVFLLAGGAISWKSTKQNALATSTMEAEFIGCYNAADQACWIKNFVIGIKVVDSIAKPIKILCDNQAAVFYSKNNKRNLASRHMDIKYLTVRAIIKEGKVIIEHVDTQAMLADPFTKGLPVGVFKNHVRCMGVVESFDIVE